MPLDPSIILGARMPEVANPFAIAQQVQSLRIQQQQAQSLAEERQASAEERRARTAQLQRELHEADALNQLPLDEQGNVQPGPLYQIVGPERGAKILKLQFDLRKDRYTTEKEGREGALTSLAGIEALPAPLRAETWQARIAKWSKMGLDVSELPQEYSPEAAAEARNQLLTPDKRYDVEHPKPMEHDTTKDLLNPQTGAVIVAGKPKEEHSPALKEYNDAVAQGFKGTFEQYQNADANRKRPVTNVYGPKGTPPGDFAKTGEDFLATIPANWRTTVKKIANYDEDPAKVASMRGGMRETVMQWVNQVNPGYDSSQFTNRAPTRKAFTTGTQGQQINSINTALGHIDQLTTVAEQLGNGSFVPGNKLWNTVQTMFGADKVTNFDTLKDALAGEVSGVLAKGGATVSGIKDAQDKIHGANSPQQLAGYVKTLVPVMGSKLAELDFQYHQAMGEGDTFSALSPQSKAILVKHGFDPKHPEVGQTGNTQQAQQRPIPGIPGGIAELRNGKWIRIK